MNQLRKVYVLQHTRCGESDYEDTKFLGVYSTATVAEQAILRYRLLPGFRDHANGFVVDCYLLDEDNWTEGFGEGVENGEIKGE